MLINKEDHDIFQRILKKLYTLNVPKSLTIITVLTLPLIIFLVGLPDYATAIRLAHFAILYFVIAFILYGFLYAISHLPKSNRRKKLVIFTRIYIRFHIAVAIIGTLFICLHALLMLSIIPLTSPLAISGLFSLLSLLGVLVTGYLRKQKSSGRRRRYHRYTAFIFIATVIIHMLLH